jgi:phenylpyruvate tautomerase PptA (4-oxalocrotonate tautomerase family)
MPLVAIKVFKNELSNSQAKDLIQKVTEAVIPFVGENCEITSGS